MKHDSSSPIRVLLVGAPRSTFREAAELARSTGAEVCLADDAQSALEQLRAAGRDLVIIDVELDVPAFIRQLQVERFAIPVLACGVDAPADRAVAAIRAGARDYLPLPPQRDLIAAAIGSITRRPLRLISSCETMERAVRYGLSMAPTSAPVLIRGESGTGKETLARAIHEASNRSGHFVSVECRGVSAEILESELFGHEPGAFAGAVAQRIGRLEEAANGTVFLRGIDTLPPALQARLLDALKSCEIYRMGGGTAASAAMSTRVIASTTNSLEELVEKGLFRADLLAKFDLAEINIPPLRERGPDIAGLAEYFADQLAKAHDLPTPGFSKEALAMLNRYAWPANVRELEETIHRAILLARSKEVCSDQLVHADGSLLSERLPHDTIEDISVEKLVGHTVADVERKLILQTLERCGGNRTSASSILGISVRTMRNKLKSFVEAGIPSSTSS